MNFSHKSVLKKEAIDYLRVKEGQLYIDATAGGGGHLREIHKMGGKVLAIDRDPAAIKHLLSFKLKNITVLRENFSHIYKIAEEFGFKNVSGIIFDLGLSSHQLQDIERGFSFQKKGQLDMRMDPNLHISAFDIVNNFEKRRLNEIFQNYADERLSRPIADAIISARKVKQIETTEELAILVREVYFRRGIKSKTDPATKVFQAIRIVVNSELLNLEEALPQTEKLLKGGGRLVVISFHSLEDAIVKRFFKNSFRLKVITKSPIGPTYEEVRDNPRSRSAKMRVAEAK